jgi:hypothetical protein
MASGPEQMIGTSIGVYRINAKLGAGGMGEVIAAARNKVAAKVLPTTAEKGRRYKGAGARMVPDCAELATLGWITVVVMTAASVAMFATWK